MAELEDLEAALAQLRRTRQSGIARTAVDGVEVGFKTDDEMAAVEASLVARIAALSGTAIHTIRIASTKGLEE